MVYVAAGFGLTVLVIGGAMWLKAHQQQQAPNDGDSGLPQ